MNNKSQKRYSLTRRIVGLTIFIDALFLIIVVFIGMFLFSVIANDLKERYVETETDFVLNSSQHMLQGIQQDANAMALSTDMINYIEYINAGNDPVIPETDPNYSLYEKVMLIMNNTLNHHNDSAYASIFIAVEDSCLGQTTGCLITSDGQVLGADEGWILADREWYSQMENQSHILTNPYSQDLSNTTRISYVQRIFDLQGQTIAYIGVALDMVYFEDYFNTLVEASDNDILVLSYRDNQADFVYFTDDSYQDYLLKDLEDFSRIDQENGFDDQGIAKIINGRTDQLLSLDAFDNNYIITYNQIEDFNWEVIVLVHDSQVLPFEILLIIALSVVSLLIVIMGILINVRVKKALQPLHDIIHSIDEIKNGNYQVQAKVYENNEIREIADAINLMSEEIDRQVKLIYDNFAYDPLTGLKNKSAVTKEINQTLLKGDKKTAVCLLQVDNLKDIIIIKGQMMGDSLIKAIAEEIQLIISDDEYLYSNGGNELIYIIPNFKNLAEVRDKVSRIVTRFKQPIVVNYIKSEIKIFAGIATYPTDDYHLDELIKKCDISIFKDKNTDKKQVIFYNDKISQEISYQAEVSEQLAQALEKKEIFLKYQPLIDKQSEIYGFEALARWASPVLGNISPEVFIANAEENYLIIPIGTWILREACKMQVALRKRFEKEFVISVNVSLIQILQNDYVDIVKSIVKETDINPNYLTLELTESIFIKSTIALDDKIEELHQMGIRFSLDDFGTGYASLTYLRNIAFDNLKIDKSFIDGILDTKKENRIVGTIVNLVHNLDMKVIAEGVEHKSQYEYLKQISTDIFQGYLMSKPLTVEETVEYIEQFYKVARNKRVDVLASKNE
ncbi:EAL domain-containing protein [Hujiaoplasma nucleasis]|uniref:EAL domain-containing protein n=1 Tax=Hujiaoplasma nucleasis TaxID=2725268 RepID=A0A7L6N3H7_9MOLU|nr:EAL domain-containing protein [Hujiaoplasma nucleasis]QLY40101.1 EAL domain-containing protein [Hujiaoplasma nucleasis]